MLGMKDAVRANDILYVSLHIPKTGGSTFLAVLEKMFGKQLQKAYRNQEHIEFVKNPQCIHGHDLLEMFGDVIDRYQRVYWITFLREPLPSAISMYYYGKKRAIAQKNVAFDFERSLEEFLTHDRIDEMISDKPLYNHNRYSKWLKRHGKTISDFDFVGVTEVFDASLSLLYEQFGWPKISYQMGNKGNYKNPVLREDVVHRFKMLNAEDYQLYEEAKNLIA